MNPNEQLIEEFYASFAAHEPETMASCYHKDILFQDPVFGKLEGKDVSDMWKMLIKKSKGNLKIEFSDIKANDKKGSARWVASYNFYKTNREVRNVIYSKFEFKDGLIFRHYDQFNFWKWTQQALGLPGYLMGWSPFLKKKIQQQSIALLRKFQSIN